MNKVLLVLSFVALSLSGAWASSIQDDDLIDFELIVLTSDGENWIGASGAKIKYADSKAISSWRRDQERGGNRTIQAAVKAIGQTAESGSGGAVKLRVPDKRLSLVCELDGLVTVEIFSVREVKTGRAEMQLKNGHLEMEWANAFNSMKEGAESYITFQLLDKEGAPLSHVNAQGLAYFRHEDFPVMDFEGQPRAVLGQAVGAPHMTNSEGKGFVGIYLEEVRPYETSHVFFSFTEREELANSFKEVEKFSLTELHVRAFNQDPYEYLPEILTTRQIISGPIRPGANEFGPLLMSRPPVLAAGVVLDATGVPIEGLFFSGAEATVEGEVFEWESPGWSPYSFHHSFSKWATGVTSGSRVPPEIVFTVQEPYGGLTDSEGRFEIRGRVFPDSIEAELQTKTSSQDWIHEDVGALGGTVSLSFHSLDPDWVNQPEPISDSPGVVDWSGPLGSEDVQIQMPRPVELRGNVLVPDGFPFWAILIHARKPDGTLAGGAMSLDAQGAIQMHSAPRIRHGNPSEWSKRTYGGVTYDESSPAEIDPGIWDVCFELKGERDWEDPAPFHVILAVEFSGERVTEDLRLREIDLREHLHVYALFVQDAEGAPIKSAMARCKPSSGREWLLQIEQGVGVIATTSTEVDVEIMAPGHSPSSVTLVKDQAENVRVVSLERGVPITLSIPEGLDVPASVDAQGERAIRFVVKLRDSRYTQDSGTGRDEKPFGRRHPDMGYRGQEVNYIATDRGGGGMVISKNRALQFSGRLSEEGIFESGNRELTLFVPEAGRYEVEWGIHVLEVEVLSREPLQQINSITPHQLAAGEADIQEGETPTLVELDITQAALDARLVEIRRKR